MTSEDQATVLVIDDDARMRKALECLLKSVICHSAGFSATQTTRQSELPRRRRKLAAELGLFGDFGVPRRGQLEIHRHYVGGIETGVHGAQP